MALPVPIPPATIAWTEPWNWRRNLSIQSAWTHFPWRHLAGRYRLAALHHSAPERVERLILLSPGSLEGREQKERRGDVPDAAYVLKYIMPRALPASMLTSGFGSNSEPSEELKDQWFELWRLEGQREAQLDRLSQYKVFDVESAFRAVDKPVLLLWGEENTTAKFEQAEEVQHLLEETEVTFISYPGVGHMAVQQAGAEIGEDVRAWLDGTLEIAETSTHE